MDITAHHNHSLCSSFNSGVSNGDLAWQQRRILSNSPSVNISQHSSMQDANPGYALRKIQTLFEAHKFDECSILINRLSYVTVKTILAELPVDTFIEAVPQSVCILESLYAKFTILDVEFYPVEFLHPERVVLQLVRWASKLTDPASKRHSNYDYFQPIIRSLLRIIVHVRPEITMRLVQRREALKSCMEGLGKHGLVNSASDDDKLVTLHDALKKELQNMAQQLKNGAQKLDELSLAHRRAISRSLNSGPAPIRASHQRMMQITQSEVQERLIKHKTLLNIVEPAVSKTYLNALIGLLVERIESDKDVLLNYSGLKKDMKDLPSNCVVAPVFQNFCHGYDTIIGLLTSDIGEVGGLDRDSIESGYGKTDSDTSGSTGVVASKPKPILGGGSSSTNVAHSAPYPAAAPGPSGRNGHGGGGGGGGGGMVGESLPAAVALGGGGGGDSALEGREVMALRKEVSMLRQELAKCRETISKMQDKEKILRDRLSDQVQKQFEKSTTKFEDLSLGENRPTQLLRRFGNLYSQIRLDAYDALDDLPEMMDFDDLKGKLLFSVIVLAFRSAQMTLHAIKGNIRAMLCIPSSPDHPDELSPDPLARDVETSVAMYLRKSLDKYDIHKNIREVSDQVYATLFDYPSLRECEGLKLYIDECVKLAWAVTVQNPPLVLEYDRRIFSADMHSRFHSSNPDSDQIQTVLWPALLEGENGVCVHKGVVIT